MLGEDYPINLVEEMDLSIFSKTKIQYISKGKSGAIQFDFEKSEFFSGKSSVECEDEDEDGSQWDDDEGLWERGIFEEDCNTPYLIK